MDKKIKNKAEELRSLWNAKHVTEEDLKDISAEIEKLSYELCALISESEV